MNPYVSVVVPAYNEELNLRRTVTVVAAKLGELATTFEIIIVDDGSTDGTPEIARELAEADRRVRILNHARNLGPGSGLFTGIKAARGDFVIFIPADLALDPDDLHKYIDASRRCDLVAGIRSDRSDYSLPRKFISIANIFLIKLLFGMKQRQFNYIHMYRTSMLREIDLDSQSVFITAEIMIKARDLGRRIEEVDIRYVPRTGGKAACGNPGVVYEAARDLFGFWWKRNFSAAARARREPTVGV